MKKIFLILRITSLIMLSDFSSLQAMTPEEERKNTQFSLPLLHMNEKDIIKTRKFAQTYLQEDKNPYLHPSSIFMPLAKGLQEYIATLPEGPIKQRLHKLFRVEIEFGEPRYGSLLTLYFEAAHARMAPSEEERHVFKNALQSLDLDEFSKKLCDGLSDQHLWGLALASFFRNDVFSENSDDLFISELSFQISEHIDAELHKRLPLPYPMPVIQEGKFRISPMIHWMLNDIYPIRFGTSSL